MAASASAVAGNCTYPDDIAADGSICGGRAASVRAGGEVPPPEYGSASIPVADTNNTSHYVTKADCNNGYSVIETSIISSYVEHSEVTFIKNGAIAANNSDVQEVTTFGLDGITSISNVTAKHENASGIPSFYTLAYEWKDSDIKNNSGAVVVNRKVVATCKVTMMEESKQ